MAWGHEIPPPILGPSLEGVEPLYNKGVYRCGSLDILRAWSIQQSYINQCGWATNAAAQRVWRTRLVSMRCACFDCPCRCGDVPASRGCGGRRRWDLYQSTRESWLRTWVSVPAVGVLNRGSRGAPFHIHWD